jgi:Na+-translocating ferredoxin:NAD+ oxidoreductase subunit B
MEKDVYHRLREQLDRYAFGYPGTASGVEIELLKLMFSEEEAGLFTQLSAQSETPAEIAARIGKPVAEMAARMEDMAGKGLLFRERQGDTVRYSAVPFIHGLLEFQVTRLGKPLVKLTGEYIKEVYKTNMAQGMRSFVRTVPIQESVSSPHEVAPYDDARQILCEADLIVITECACRQQMGLFDKACGKPREVCFMFGPMGQYYIDNGLGRKIDIEEALQILARAHEAGCVTQPAAARSPFTMCNCCVDCCGFLKAVSKHAKPAELVFSNYRVDFDRDRCIGCGTCVERCGMGAATVSSVDGLSEQNPDRCIGCGLCVTTCPAKVRRLVPKEGEARVPVADTPSMFAAMARDRGIASPRRADVISFGFPIEESED